MTISKSERASIAAARRTPTETLRIASPGLEAILFNVMPVLDHGFVRVIDYMGDDSSVVQAARVSYGTGTKTSRQDAALLNYLMQNNHTTPFEMAEIKLHVRLPIFVARQWVRHRTANINEYSARYSILDKEFYLPSPGALAAQSEANRQGRDDILSEQDAAYVLNILRHDATVAYDHYLDLLNEDERGKARDLARRGLARELARMNLTLNYYTQWYWKIDLHNFMRFIALRIDPHAQYEIRVYAEVLLDILHKWVPLTAAAFEEHRLHALTLSASAVNFLRARLAGKEASPESSGLTAREWKSLKSVFGL